MRKRDAALLAFAGRRNEHQVAQVPGCLVSILAALPAHQSRQDAAHDHHRQTARLEVDPENTPRLPARQRAQLFDGAHLDRQALIQSQLGRAVIKAQVIGLLFIHRPAQLGAQVFDQRWEILDGTDVGEFGVGHGGAPLKS